MARFDRYVLSRFMVMFGFFALVMVSIFWINEAVRVFDRLVGDGQPAWIFLEFTALTLPGVIGVVLPMATFAAAIHVTNRLSGDGELTVVQAAGYSPWRLVRPALVFGVTVAVIMSLLSHLLIPASLGELRRREIEVRQNVSARFIEDGKFLHPAPGITFYIRDVTDEGELREVFLSDRRAPDRPVIYTSTRAYLVQEEAGTKLVMLNGLAQSLRAEGKRLYTSYFDDFSYNISSLVARNPARLNKLEFTPTAELIRNRQAVMEKTGATLPRLLSHLHQRFAQALFCIAAALVGFATLMLGNYSRFGIWWQILAAIVLLVGLKLVDGAVTGIVLESAAAWPLTYLPGTLGIGITLVLLDLAARPWLLARRGSRRAAAGGAP